MKILVITTVPLRKNGITTFIQNVFPDLVQHGFQVDVLSTVLTDVRTSKELECDGIHVYTLKKQKIGVAKYLYELMQLMLQNKYDIVHINGSSASISLELLISVLAKVKIRVAHSHNTKSNHPILHRILRPLVRLFSNRQIACSTSAGIWMYGRAQFTVINNGINLSKYCFSGQKRLDIRQKYDINNDELVIGHVGNFNPQKNQKYLVPILKDLVLTQQRHIKLILVGDGRLRKKVENDFLNANLGSHVIFTGSVDNVPEILNACDVFMLPSLFEGLPFVLVEAQANGLSCIVSDAVSQDAFLSGDMSFIPLNSPHEWIKRINASEYENMNDRSTRSMLACQDLIRRGYSISSTITQVESEYGASKLV